MRAFNGRAGWVHSPRGLLKEYEVTGSELGRPPARRAACASRGRSSRSSPTCTPAFPTPSTTRRSTWCREPAPRASWRRYISIRSPACWFGPCAIGKSPVGRVPTQFDYDDYRDVGGIKFPFKITFSWLDGRDAYQLSEVKTNVPIDASKFDKPVAR